jgi:deoxyribodipyrimidine photo-lyase
MRSACTTSKSPNIAIIWFQQNNLRLLDNEILLLAQERHEYVLPLFCFDSYYYPSLSTDGETRGGQFASLPALEIPKTGPHKTKFILESVQNLRENLARSNQQLVIRKGKSEEVITSLAIECGARAVYCNSGDAFDEIQQIDLVQRHLRDRGVDLVSPWGNTLYSLTDLPFRFRDDFPTSASAFRTICEKKLSIPEPISLHRHGNGYEIRPLPPNVINLPSSWFGELPSLEELCPALDPSQSPSPSQMTDYNPKSCLHFQGGETAGLQRLQEYFFETDSLKDYFHTRNGLLGPNYSSKFSPWLAAGCLSPRFIVSEIHRYEMERVKNKDTYWLILELHFRDYFKFPCLMARSCFLNGGHGDIVTAIQILSGTLIWNCFRRGLLAKLATLWLMRT